MASYIRFQLSSLVVVTAFFIIVIIGQFALAEAGLNVIQLENNLKLYEAGSGNKVVILVYDLFGVHEHAEFIAERLADNLTSRVVIPDFFRGRPWDTKKWPANQSALNKFITTNGSWERVVKPDLKSVLTYYEKSQNVVDFGIFGFCWGGKMSMHAVVTGEFKRPFKAAGAVHPAPFPNSLSSKINAPVILLPSKDEANLLSFTRALKKRLGSDNCVHKRYSDMSHGFAGALGQWKDSKVMTRVNDVLSMLALFYAKHDL